MWSKNQGLINLAYILHSPFSPSLTLLHILTYVETQDAFHPPRRLPLRLCRRGRGRTLQEAVQTRDCRWSWGRKSIKNLFTPGGVLLTSFCCCSSAFPVPCARAAPPGWRLTTLSTAAPLSATPDGSRVEVPTESHGVVVDIKNQERRRFLIEVDDK